MSEKTHFHQTGLESEEWFRLLVENLNDAIFSVDSVGNVIYASPVVEQMFGYRPLEQVGLPFSRYIHPDDLEMVQASFLRTLQGSFEPLEFRMLDAAGNIRFVRSSSRPILKDGAPAGLTGIITDITDRKQSEDKLLQAREELEQRVQIRTADLAKSNQALQESEEHYRQLITALPSALIVFVKDAIVYANPAVTDIFGYEPLDIVNRSMYEFISAADREMITREMDKLERGEPARDSFELMVTSRNGDLRDARVQIAPIWFDQRQAELAILTDVTGKKQDEKIQEAVYRISQAANSVENLRDLFGSIHTIIGDLMFARNFYIALIDSETGLLEFPYFIDEIDVAPLPRKQGKGLTEYVTRTGAPLLASTDTIRQLVDSGEVEVIGPWSLDWLGVPLKIKDKTIGVVVVQTYSAGPRYTDKEKDILMFVSNQVAMSIERKRAEEALRQSEDRKRAILSAIPDLIFMIDRDGVFLDCKADKETDLLMPPVEFLNRSIFDVLPPDLASLTLENIHNALDKQTIQIYEYELVLQNERRYFEARAVVGGQDQVLVLARDITEKRKLEQQILRAQKMESIGTMAGGIAHDFNNILAGILGYVSLMKSKITPDHAFYKYVTTIERGAVRAADLTSKLLAFSRGGKIDVKPLNVNHIILETLEIIRHTFDKSIMIEDRLNASLPLVEGDAGQIQQVVMNLCLNARDAMAKGGRLILETAIAPISMEYCQTQLDVKPGRYIRMIVSDTGCGMNKQTLGKIFDPFFTTKEKGQGTGLGLSMVYGIVKNHEGFMDVYSEPGQGTTFKVYLPVSDKTEPAVEEVAAPAHGRDELIFIVEDEEDIRSFLKDMLEVNGYRTIFAENGEIALDLYRINKSAISLVILDMVMPGMGGEETFINLKMMDPEIKVLLSTGFSKNGKVEGILNLGARGFIQKPYDYNFLLFKIRQVLDN